MSSSGWNDNKPPAWREAQQRYWEGLAELSRFKSSASDPLDAPAWKQGLEQWLGKVALEAPPQTHDILKRLLGMGKVYLGLAEQVYGSTSAQDDVPNLENWMQSLEAGLGHWQEHLHKALPPSGLGLIGETFVDLAALSEQTLGYQRAMDTYLKAFSVHGQASVQQLRQRVQQLAVEGKALNSLRELYDVWVDVSEASYGEFVMTPRYQVIYGQMVNAFFALRQEANRVLDKHLHAAGVPTREDMHLAWRKQHVLRRENHALRQQMQAVELRLLQLEKNLASGEAAHDSV